MNGAGPPVVVFDTNVLFSAVGWRGRPYRCLELARTGRVESVTCQEILAELEEKLLAKLAYSAGEVAEELADLLACSRVVSIPGVLQAVEADPDDNMVLECAVVAGVDYVVSGDHHLQEMRVFRGMPLLSPREFLAEIGRLLGR